MNRRARRSVSLLAAIVLVMAQLAVSAFACAMPLTMSASPSQAMPPGCHEGAAADDSLCQRHCHEEAQSQAPLAFAASPFVASFVVFLAAPAAAPTVLPVPSRALLHATSPPLAIANCCLRV